MTDPKAMAGAGTDEGVTHPAALPPWFPDWARRLGELYFSGTTSVFVLHGNTFDLVRIGDGGSAAYGTLADFVAEQLFGRWDLVLHYDLARGLRCLPGRDGERLKRMLPIANQRIGDLSAVPKDPTTTLALLDRFVRKNVMAEDGDRLSVALFLDHASYVVPRSQPGHTSSAVATHLVTLLGWATSPYVKRLNMAVILADQSLADLSERLTGNPHVAAMAIPLPDETERRAFMGHAAGEQEVSAFSDYGLDELAALTAGISLTDVNVMLRTALEGGQRLDEVMFRRLKKRLIERQAQGMLEFIEPKWGLETVVGHEAAKARLKQDAELLRRGRLESVPMGYLVCGPVGTGKSFLAQCSAGAIGIPCVKLKNFRSKYVGETEGNLERVLGVLRSMGPVVVIVDEADAMLGDREQGGDSGVGSRVFGMIAAQMGDTTYRGRIIWMLLTARPDLLPVDLKRQGRAEVHIPLFYPQDETEIRDLFVVLARKVGTLVRPEDVPAIPHRGDLSGADIEGIIGRAWRASLLSGATHVTAEALAEAVAGFMPSTQTLEREMQELAAIIECTDREFLPPAVRERLEAAGGRARLQERFNEVRRMVESG